MYPRRVLAQRSRELLTRQLMERHRLASEMAEAFESEARDARATVDHSDRPGSVSPLAAASEESFALAADAHRRIREIDRALSRMANGTYGRCEDCGHAIPYQRLRALPATAVCVDCGIRRRPSRSTGEAAREGVAV
jgi:RNA polymerase-binding transcription factor DksA